MFLFYAIFMYTCSFPIIISITNSPLHPNTRPTALAILILNLWPSERCEVSLRDLNNLGLSTTVAVAKPRKVSQLVAGWSYAKLQFVCPSMNLLLIAEPFA